MKIIDNRQSTAVKVSEIKARGTFLQQDLLYIKMSNKACSGFRLDTGFEVVFDKNEICTPVNIEIAIV